MACCGQYFRTPVTGNILVEYYYGLLAWAAGFTKLSVDAFCQRYFFGKSAFRIAGKRRIFADRADCTGLVCST